MRYTADPSGNVANLASRLVLIGHDEEDGIANCHASHAVGTAAFGDDGSLFVGAGEGAHFEHVDGGQDLTQFDPLCEQMFGDQDVGALRAQDYHSLAGKILRIDPATGLGYPNNPFFDGDPASPASRIWVLGLRNPFRFTVRPEFPGPRHALRGRRGLDRVRGNERGARRRELRLALLRRPWSSRAATKRIITRPSGSATRWTRRRSTRRSSRGITSIQGRWASRATRRAERASTRARSSRCSIRTRCSSATTDPTGFASRR